GAHNPKDRAMTSHQFPSVCPSLRMAPNLRRKNLARWTNIAAVAALSALLLPAIAGCSKDATTSSSASDGSSTARAADPNDPTIAKVNGIEIRASDLALAEDDLGQEAHQQPPEIRREQTIAYLADIILASQAAEKANLRSDPGFKQRQA